MAFMRKACCNKFHVLLSYFRPPPPHSEWHINTRLLQEADLSTFHRLPCCRCFLLAVPRRVIVGLDTETQKKKKCRARNTKILFRIQQTFLSGIIFMPIHLSTCRRRRAALLSGGWGLYFITPSPITAEHTATQFHISFPLPRTSRNPSLPFDSLSSLLPSISLAKAEKFIYFLLDDGGT